MNYQQQGLLAAWSISSMIQFGLITGQIYHCLSYLEILTPDIIIIISYHNWQNLHNKSNYNDEIQFVFITFLKHGLLRWNVRQHQPNKTWFLFPTTSSSLSSGIGGDCMAILEGKLLLTCILRFFFFFFFFLWWWSAWRTFFCDLLRRGRRGWWIWGNELLRWPEKVKIRSITTI